MSESNNDLQALLERIQNEGIRKAESEAETLLSEARKKAADLIATAKAEAEGLVRNAQKEAELFTQRGRTSVEQASRDLLLSVEQALQSMLQSIVLKEVSGGLSGDTLQRLLLQVVEAYSAAGLQSKGLEVSVPAASEKAVRDFFMAKLSEAVKRGVTVKGDAGLAAGFRVSVAGAHVQHDFSAESIAEALGERLRPQLREILRSAARSNTKAPAR